MIKTKQILLVSLILTLALPAIILVFNGGLYYADYHRQISVKTDSLESYTYLSNNLTESSRDLNLLRLNFDIREEQKVLDLTKDLSDVEIYYKNSNLVEVREALLGLSIVIITSIVAAVVISIKNSKLFFKNFLYFTYSTLSIYFVLIYLSLGVLSAFSRLTSISTFSLNSIFVSILLVSIFVIMRSNVFNQEDRKYTEIVKEYFLMISQDTFRLTLIYLISTIAIFLAARESSLEFTLALLISNLGLFISLKAIVQNLDSFKSLKKTTVLQESSKLQKEQKSSRKQIRKSPKKKRRHK